MSQVTKFQNSRAVSDNNSINNDEIAFLIANFASDQKHFLPHDEAILMSTHNMDF